LDQLPVNRIGVFDQDKPKALLIQQLGAQAVSVDLANVGTKFNKGMGTQGTVVRLPAIFPTVQMLFNAEKQAPGFGEASRQFWLAQFERQTQNIQRAEASIPAKVWTDIEPSVLAGYVASLKEGRLMGAKQGLYAKRTLNLLKKARCAASPDNAECAVAIEVD